jgi:hypothetical protein
MTMFRLALAAAVLLAVPATAQVGVRASTADAQEEAIVVQGKKKEVAQALRQLIQPSGNDQLARFEDKVCPMVIGMPRDWTQRMTRMIRDNVVAVGGTLEPEGCKPNALAIFIDQPKELVKALHDDAPFFFNMTPRQYDNFEQLPGPVWSWHVTDTRTRDGTQMAQASIGTNDFGVVRNAGASRLYSNVREDMLVGFVVIDRQKTIGTTLRQLADLATMHLLLDVRQDAGSKDLNSILSLFAARPEGMATPARFSTFDKGALRGFYTQRENNREARQQRENIASAVRKGASDKDK